jgi:Actin-fragmin kinase, catalytic
MKWKNLKDIARSNYGQDGVYFISDGEVDIVLKAPESPCAELFLAFTANTFGLKTPEITVVYLEKPEYKNIIKAIKSYVDRSNNSLSISQQRESEKSQAEQDLELMEKRSLNLDSSPIFFVMEDLRGFSLRDVSQEDFEIWYGRDENITSQGEKLFTDLGKLLVLDLLVRNIDRFILWNLPGIGAIESALGNIGNIFIRDENKELVVIDSLMDRNIDASTYGNAVKDILSRTISGEADNLVDRAQETIALIGYEVKKNGRTLILQGVREGMKTLDMLNQGEALNEIKKLSLEQLPKSEQNNIDAIFEFIKKTGAEISSLFAEISERQPLRDSILQVGRQLKQDACNLSIPVLYSTKEALKAIASITEGNYNPTASTSISPPKVNNLDELQSERSAISAILQVPQALDDMILRGFTSECLINPQHREICVAAVEYHGEHGEVNLPNIRNRLSNDAVATATTIVENTNASLLSPLDVGRLITFNQRRDLVDIAEQLELAAVDSNCSNDDLLRFLDESKRAIRETENRSPRLPELMINEGQAEPERSPKKNSSKGR